MDMQENSPKNILARLFWILIILLSVLVGAYLGKGQLTNPFLHYDVAFTEAARNDRYVVFPDEGALAGLRYTRGRELWMISMGKLLGLDSQVLLQFLPIGSIILSLTYFAFFKRLLGSDTVAALMTLYQMMSPSHLGGVYSVFAYAMGLTLYLGFVLLFVRVQDKRRIPDILLLFAVAVAANTIHYAYTIWIVLTGMIINVWIWAMRRSPNSRQRTRIPEYTMSFVLFVIVIFLIFSEVFYDSYLPYVGDAEVLGGGWATFFHQLPWRTGFGIGEVFYEFGYTRSRLLSVLSTLNLVLILIPIAAGILLWVFRRMRYRREGTDTIIEPVMWALILTGVLDMAIYSLRGNIGLKYLLLIYPVATVWFLRQIGGKRLVALGLVLLLSLSFVRLVAEATEGYIGVQPLSYSQTETATTWYHQHTAEPNALLFSDLNLYGKLLVKGASCQHPGLHRPRLLVITPEVYDWLLGREVTDADELTRIGYASYVVLDMESDAPVKTFFWRELQPLGWHRSSIERNSVSVKLYDDGLVWILQP